MRSKFYSHFFYLFYSCTKIKMILLFWKSKFPHLEAYSFIMPTKSSEFYKRPFFSLYLKNRVKKVKKNWSSQKKCQPFCLNIFSHKILIFSRSLDSVTSLGFSPSDKVVLLASIRTTFKYQYASGQHANIFSFMQVWTQSPGTAVTALQSVVQSLRKQSI